MHENRGLVETELGSRAAWTALKLCHLRSNPHSVQESQFRAHTDTGCSFTWPNAKYPKLVWDHLYLSAET